jgi:hypothetical protein
MREPDGDHNTFLIVGGLGTLLVNRAGALGGIGAFLAAGTGFAAPPVDARAVPDSCPATTPDAPAQPEIVSTVTSAIGSAVVRRGPTGRHSTLRR